MRPRYVQPLQPDQRPSRCPSIGSNLPLFPGIFPDQMAPIVCHGPDGERELVVARWGMPSLPQFGGAPITNIRNLNSPHWRRWLWRSSRCIFPATSFCEYADTKPRKTPKWFALGDDRPLFAFAGLWTPRRGVRGPKSAPIEGAHELFGFLTTAANAIVAPIHPKAMPVILTTPAEVDLWLAADAPKALELQRPLPDDAAPFSGNHCAAGKSRSAAGLFTTSVKKYSAHRTVMARIDKRRDKTVIPQIQTTRPRVGALANHPTTVSCTNGAAVAKPSVVNATKQRYPSR
jgi:putative SOS response-associated peptidase YedK